VLDSSAVGDSVTFTVNVAQAGIYDVSYTTKEYPTRGTTQLTINGINAGPVTDQFSASELLGSFDLGDFAAASNYSFL
jgi:hypothetical protein